MPVENVTFSDIQLDTKTGFTMKDAKGIEFHRVTINTESGPAVTVSATDGLEIDGVKTTKPHAGVPVIQLDEVKNVFVHDCLAAPGTETFLRVNEDSADNVTLEGNNLKQAKTAVEKVGSTGAAQ
jgi:hypothetical protein